MRPSSPCWYIRIWSPEKFRPTLPLESMQTPASLNASQVANCTQLRLLHGLKSNCRASSPLLAVIRSLPSTVLTDRGVSAMTAVTEDHQPDAHYTTRKKAGTFSKQTSEGSATVPASWGARAGSEKARAHQPRDRRRQLRDEDATSGSSVAEPWGRDEP